MIRPMSPNEKTLTVDPEADHDNDHDDNSATGYDDLPRSLRSNIDGGWGWVVCLGCFACHVITDGLFYSFGIIFVELLNAFGGTKGDTSVIGSLSTGTCLLTGPIISILVNKFGCRAVTICGACVASTGLFVSAFAPNIQFLYFSMGILTGFGYGMIYLPAIVSVSVYFEKKRSLATGIGVGGSGIGTFIMSPLTSVLIQQYAWQGAVIVQSGLLLHCVACGLLFLPLTQQHTQRLKDTTSKSDERRTIYDETRKSSKSDCDELEENQMTVIIEKESNGLDKIKYKKAVKKRQSKSPMGSGDNELSIPLTSSVKPDYDCEKTHQINSLHSGSQPSLTGSTGSHTSCTAVTQELFHYKMFTSVTFDLFLVSSFFYGLGYYVPYIYLPDTAMKMGISEFQSSWLLSTVGITNTVGRIVFGYLSDWKWVNRLLLYNVSLIICGVCTALAPLLRAYWALMVYSSMFGIFSGVTVSLTSVILADIVGIDKLSNAFGMCNFVAGVSVFAGPPVAGWLYDVSGDYLMCYIYSGVAIVLSGAILFIVQCLEHREQNTEL